MPGSVRCIGRGRREKIHPELAALWHGPIVQGQEPLTVLGRDAPANLPRVDGLRRREDAVFRQFGRHSGQAAELVGE